jgi:hypothetical protein
VIYSPKKYEIIRPNVNKELLSLEGELTDEQAKAAFGKFLRANLGFGLELLTNKKVKLAYFQEILLKALFNRNFSMIVASRGASKSFLAALIAFLYPLFNPNTNTIICGPTFRTSRHIFNNLEKIVDSKEGILLKQCFGAKTKRNDAFEYEINGGIIRAIPMNSERLRGFRSQLLIMDEYLLFSEEVVKKVLMPFLMVPSNVTERMSQFEEDEEKLKSGEIKSGEEMIFPSSARMVCLTSASYQFEYCYQQFNEWVGNIISEDAVKDATYFVAQLGYEIIPKYLVEKSVIEEASSSGADDPIFQREFGAQFVDGSQNYFNAQKMHKLTIPDSNRPTVLIKGNPNKKYILSVDANYNDSPTSDHFAMAVGELDEENEKIVLVHNYANAGAGLKGHINYFYYLLNNFNIVMICADNADAAFFSSANESVLFQQNKIKIEQIEYDGELQGEEYNQMIRKVRNQYNLNGKKILFKHIFNQSSIRRINEQLQTWINTSKICFGSRLSQHGEDYDAAIKCNLIFPEDDPALKNGISNFIYSLIEKQDDNIYLVKKETAVIEVTISNVGGQQFSLPAMLNRQTGANRTRKDSYSALLLVVEGANAYYNLMKAPKQEKSSLFIPQMFGNSTYR